METKTRTKGNIIIEEIEIDDIHYEFGYGKYIQSQVISLPKAEVRENDTYWTWGSKCLLTGKVIQYGVSDKYAHYGPNLYNYMAYIGCKQTEYSGV